MIEIESNNVSFTRVFLVLKMTETNCRPFFDLSLEEEDGADAE